MEIWLKIECNNILIDMIIDMIANKDLRIWRDGRPTDWPGMVSGMSKDARNELSRNISFLYLPDDLCEN